MMAIDISDKAAAHIAALLAKNPDAIGVRLGTTKYGCNGLAYRIDYVTEPETADELVEDKGVRLYVDRRSLLFLLGTRMDWEETPFSTGFTFSNPNEKGRCGCGESFNI